jgi:hypothetical protein
VDTSRTVISKTPPAPLGDETWSGCEHVIEEFERVWREGGSPAIDEFWLSQGERRLDLLREFTSIWFRLARRERPHRASRALSGVAEDSRPCSS